jgi:hypothetical protein
LFLIAVWSVPTLSGTPAWRAHIPAVCEDVRNEFGSEAELSLELARDSDISMRQEGSA